MDYLERAKRNKELSDREVDALRTCAQDSGRFYSHVKEFVRLRYFVEDTDYWTDDLPALAAFSIVHAQETAGEEVVRELRDTSLTCGGVTSAGTKQILLIMALKKMLGVQMTPEEIGLTSDVRVLSGLLRERFVQICEAS